MWRFHATISYKNGAWRSVGAYKERDQFWDSERSTSPHLAAAGIRHHPVILEMLQRLGIYAVPAEYESDITDIVYALSAQSGNEIISISLNKGQINSQVADNVAAALLDDADFVRFFDIGYMPQEAEMSIIPASRSVRSDPPVPEPAVVAAPATPAAPRPVDAAMPPPIPKPLDAPQEKPTEGQKNVEKGREPPKPPKAEEKPRKGQENPSEKEPISHETENELHDPESAPDVDDQE